MKATIKKLAVPTSMSLALAFALCASISMQSQSAPFKLGDSVEVSYAGQWVTGIVTKDLESGTYVVNHGTTVMYINEGPQNIRAHQMTADEQASADQSAQALASWPKGNGVGAQYGAREPATCQTRAAQPSSAAIAHQYLLCDMEGLDGFKNLMLYTDVTVQLGRPRAFNYTQDSGRYQIDVIAPVIDIRGSFKEYQCGKPIMGGGAYEATHTCNLYDQPVAAGSCYRDTFGDWHCLMGGSRLASTNQVREQMPPR